MPLPQSPIEQTSAWLNEFVIKLNLCPFAKKVVDEQSVRLQLCEASDQQSMIRAVLTELDLLVQSDAKTLSTSLLVFNNTLADFSDYLNFADWANDLLIEASLEGIIQIATFHPLYVFEGVDEHDVSHYTNRSPYPMLHFIREQQLELAIAHHPDPEAIPEQNVKYLQSLGLEKVQQLLNENSR